MKNQLLFIFFATLTFFRFQTTWAILIAAPTKAVVATMEMIAANPKSLEAIGTNGEGTAFLVRSPETLRTLAFLQKGFVTSPNAIGFLLAGTDPSELRAIGVAIGSISKKVAPIEVADRLAEHPSNSLGLLVRAGWFDAAHDRGYSPASLETRLAVAVYIDTNLRLKRRSEGGYPGGLREYFDGQLSGKPSVFDTEPSFQKLLSVRGPDRAYTQEHRERHITNTERSAVVELPRRTLNDIAQILCIDSGGFDFVHDAVYIRPDQLIGILGEAEAVKKGSGNDVFRMLTTHFYRLLAQYHFGVWRRSSKGTRTFISHEALGPVEHAHVLQDIHLKRTVELGEALLDEAVRRFPDGVPTNTTKMREFNDALKHVDSFVRSVRYVMDEANRL